MDRKAKRMKVSFMGTSHAAQHLSRAAAEKGFDIVGMAAAELIFVSEDTPTDEEGRRDLDRIRELVDMAAKYGGDVPIVLTSAVPPGFTRSLGLPIWHQAETLRILDAEERARNPERIIVGCPDGSSLVPQPYMEYLLAFNCPVLFMTWEEAEFSKVAINNVLVAQVKMTNRLAAASAKVGADWGKVAEALKLDGRIGPKSYLTPGRWQNSRHLMRDWRTLGEIEA